MANEDLALIKECDELISRYYHRHLTMRLEDLEERLKRLLCITNKKFPLYTEELEKSMKLFNRHPHHYMGFISCLLSLIEKEEFDFVEYVNNERISELNNLSIEQFDFSKLIEFCNEINCAYRNKLYMAIPLLIRAIIDHIPPIFGKCNFVDVYNQYGTSSFKASMTQLDKHLRKIADATIHTQIRDKEILPNETQIDFKPALDVLLGEICRISKNGQV